MAVIVKSGPVIEGTSENDVIDHLGDTASIYGGAGTDTVVFNDLSSNYIISTLNGVTRVQSKDSALSQYKGECVVLSSVETVSFLDTEVNIETTNQNAVLGFLSILTDTIEGSNDSDIVDHFSGPEFIDGYSGTDTILFFDNIENFTITTNSGITRVIGNSTARDEFPGFNYAGNVVVLINFEVIQFLNGTYDLAGTSGGPGEFKRGTAADERLLGSSGDDLIDHGGGSDVITGGGGVDTLLFYDHSGWYTPWMTTLLGVTHLRGDGKNAIAPYAGEEIVLSGVEKIQFNNQVVDLETTNVNVVIANAGTDSTKVAGSEGDDIIDHRGGSDWIDGGAGFDTVLFFDHSGWHLPWMTRMPGGVIQISGKGKNAVEAYKDFTVQLNNIECLQFRDKRVIFGSDRDEMLQTWAGVDQMDGGGGIDTAVFAGIQSAYTTTRTNDNTGFTVNGAAGDTNTLTNVERLKFADLTIAYDLYTGSDLENAVLMGSAAGGYGFIDDPQTMGAALRFASPYNNMQSLAEAVIDLGIYDTLNHRQFVDQMFRNVRHTPTAEEVDLFVLALDFGIDESQVLRYFAESDWNEQSVNLVGLQQTGVEFI